MAQRATTPSDDAASVAHLDTPAAEVDTGGRSNGLTTIRGGSTPAPSESVLQGIAATLAGTPPTPSEYVPAGSNPARIGRFIVLKKLGEGGMGVIYSAYDDELDRKVAIKIVRSALADRAGSRARIRREAQAMARLSHPNVVQIYEVGDFRGELFVAMEFVIGETLGSWEARAREDPAQGWRAVLDRYIDAARGLAAAHAAGIVHRDFKPDNVLVGAEDGRARVLDFGIARASGDGPIVGAEQESTREEELILQSGVSALKAPLTRTGAMLGTPAYMSPEQFTSLPVDARSDQFSLCVALYEGLYGERPFEGRNVSELMKAVVTQELRPAPENTEVPAWLRAVVVRGLSVDPEDRWPSIEALILALQHDPDKLRRDRLKMLGAAAIIVVVIAAMGWFAVSQTRTARLAEFERARAVRHGGEAQEREEVAQRERDAAFEQLKAEARRSRNISRLLIAESMRVDDPTTALAMLREIEDPENTPGFVTAALNALQQPVSRAVLGGHRDRVLWIDYSPDGRWIASASGDKTVRIASTEGTGAATVLRAHTDAVRSANFSPDSTHKTYSVVFIQFFGRSVSRFHGRSSGHVV